MSNAQPMLSVGDVVDGKYQVDELIGQGGMGQVLAATHLVLGQRVALKFMSPQIMAIPGAVARFTREARAAAKLESEHVCRVLDIGETQEGAKYIVIEYLEGNDLSARLKEEGKLPEAEAIRYVIQACEALGEAHELGIVHRDIKPANLFLSEKRDGQRAIKVLDFGISKSLNADTDMVVTATNALMGSPIYMSPEQLLSPKTVDTRADIWSLGIVLHELLTGEPPFKAQTLPEVIALIVNEGKAPSSAISPHIREPLRKVIARCLVREPGARFQSTRLLAEALRDLEDSAATSEKGAAVPAVFAETQEKSLPWKWIGLGGGLIAAGAVALAFGLAGGASTEPTPRASPSETVESNSPPTGGSSKVSDSPVAPSVEAQEASVSEEAKESPETRAKPARAVDEAPTASKETVPAATEKKYKTRDTAGKRRTQRDSSKTNKRSKSVPGSKDLMDPTMDDRPTRPKGGGDMMDPE